MIPPSATMAIAAMVATRMARSTRRPRARFSSDAFDAISDPFAKPVQQLVARLPDIARAQRDHHVIALRDCQRGMDSIIDAARVLGRAMPEGSNALGHALPRNALDRLLGGGVDVQNKNVIGLVERPPEVVQQRLRPGVPVRLKQRDDAPEMAQPRRRQSGPNLGRVMA